MKFIALVSIAALGLVATVVAEQYHRKVIANRPHRL